MVLLKVNEEGFSVVEIIVAIAIILIIAASILPLLHYSSRSTFSNQNLITASNLASSIIEEIRSLDYDSIGTVGGNPEGPIEQIQRRSLNGFDYKIETLISWGSAKGKNEVNPVAYKNIRVVVKGINLYSKNETVLAELHSIAARDGEEPLVEEGHLKVQIRDINNSPIETPLLVSISGAETSSLFSDYSGQAFFGMLNEGLYNVSVKLADGMYAIGGDIFDSNSNIAVKNNVRVSNYTITEITFVVDKKENLSGIELQFIDSERETPITRKGRISTDIYFNGSSYTMTKEFSSADFTDGVLNKEFLGIMPEGAEITDIRIDGVAGYKNYMMSSDRPPLTSSRTPWDCIIPKKDVTERVFIPLDSVYFYQESTKEDFNRCNFMTHTLSANDNDTLSLKMFQPDINLKGCKSDASSVRSIWRWFTIERFPDDNAFDGNTNTYWRSGDQNNNIYWIRVELNETTALRGFSVFSEYNKGPKDFSVEVSTEGINWTTAKTGSLENTTGWKTVEFDFPVSCKHFKLNIFSKWTSSEDVQINEIELFSYDGYAPLGYRIIGPLDISAYEIAPYFKVEWDAEIPPGASFEVRMLLLDEGVEPEPEDFTDNTIVSEIDGRIPNISWGQSLLGKRLWIMEWFTPNENNDATPVLHYLNIGKLFANE